MEATWPPFTKLLWANYNACVTAVIFEKKKKKEYEYEHVYTKAQSAKCLTHQFHTTKHLNKSPGHKETAYQERGAGPRHGGQRSQIGRLAQHIELFLSDGQDLVSEGSLPGVQFQNLDPIQDFIH